MTSLSELGAIPHPAKTTDKVNHPSHYKGAYPLEVKEIIAVVLNWCAVTGDMSAWEIYCFGNELKYRLRAGLKDNAVEDIAKAMKYMEFRRGDR